MTAAAGGVRAGRRVAPLAAIPAGEGRAFLVEGVPVAVFHIRGGGLAATDARCPHRGGPLADGLVGDGWVVCPLHTRRFSLADGACDVPGECAVAVHPAAVDEEGWVVVQVP